MAFLLRARAARAVVVLCVMTLSFLPVATAGAVASHRLEPSPVGHGECQAVRYRDDSVNGQIAISKTNCTVARRIEAGSDRARGATYSSGGFQCVAVKEGPGSTWSSAWGGTYFAYSCRNGKEQVAFTWGTDYTFGESPTTTVVVSTGPLRPSALGAGQCYYSSFPDHSVDAQIAVSGTSCSVESSVEKASDVARGTSYTADGFTCVATREGSGSEWAAAWGGTYYAYSCRHGSEQVAFNWGTDYTYA